MTTALLMLIFLAIVAVVSYSVGRDDGIKTGRTQVLEEDIARMDTVNTCMDDNMMSIINNLVADEERTILTYRKVKGESTHG